MNLLPPEDLLFDCECLLFDCDGVLVDSDEAAAAAWNLWGLEFVPGFDFARDVSPGRPAGDTIEELVRSPDFARAKHALMLKETATAPMVRAIAGAVELLSSLPPGSWTVVTSALPGVAHARLRAAGLPCPENLVTAEDVRQGKPAPDPYLLGAERLGVAPAQAVVFEDAQAGITSALAAGIGLTVGVGQRALQTRAHLVVADLSSIRYDGRVLDLRQTRLLRHPDPALVASPLGASPDAHRPR